ncbi:MAG TPA: hypothetical protein VD766_07455 [Solirubrobacterales bacterium]|nr:hypothetical protein [Solirubrobacterales bacterium]
MKLKNSRNAQNLALGIGSALAFLIPVTGCGDEDAPTSGDSLAGGDVAITVTLDPDGADGPEAEMSQEVNCDDGSADAACLAVADLEASDFDPPSADQACTELFGGPDIATIQGEINGEEVDAELTRSNGCEIERFDGAVPLLQALFEDYQPGGAIDTPGAG